MKKNQKRFQRLLALLLCVAMLLPSVVVPAHAAETEEGTTPKGEPLAVVWSGSDFQYGTGDTVADKAANNKGLLQEILTAMKNDGVDKVDEALFPGDLTPSSGKEASDIGAATVLEALNETWGLTADDVIFGTGNHDSGGFDLNDATGGYDREHYSVYNINYAGFPCNGSKTVVQETAGALDAWLDAKAAAGYAKPIFVMTHLPLHHNGRYDNFNAGYIVDVLNEAGEQGLNIIFLFGHNHSGGYDRYLGGSCIYYAPGDTMLVSKVDGTVSDFSEVELNFTYMNAGYVGYAATGETGATLSACTFEIYEDRVEITRYNKEGAVNLKNAGAHSGTYDAKDAEDYLWDADTTVTASSQTLNLSDIVVSVDEENTTLGATLEKGNSAAVAIKVVSGAENYTVTWESFDPAVATVSGEGTGATVTAVENGTTTVQATVSHAAKSSGVPATVRFDVTVADDSAVQINGGEPLTLYQLVDNLYEVFDASAKYMILNTEEQGGAKAFGGADSAGGRGNDPVNYVKNVKVFPFAPAGEGLFTVSADGYDVWRFEENSKYPAAEYGYALRLASVGHYVGADKTLMPDHAGSDYEGNIRITSTLTSSDCTTTFDVVNNAANPLTTKKAFDHSGSLTIYDMTGYTLNYNSAEQYFQMTESGDPLYFYKEASVINNGWMWVEGEGSIVLEGTGAVGATLNVMIDGKVHQVPITTDMISGVYWNIPGTYSATVSYMGTEVTTEFPMTVTNEDGSVVKPVTIIDSKDGPIYRHWNFKDDQIDSGFYYAAVYKEDNHAGAGVGQILTLEDGKLVAKDIDMQELTVKGVTSLYIQPADNQLWYNATTINGIKAATYYFWQSKTDTDKFLTVSNGAPVVADQNTAVANGANWRISTDNFNLLTTSDPSVTIISDGKGGWTTIGRYVDTKTHTYYLDTELDSIVAHLDKNSGSIEADATGKLLPGGNVVVSTFFKDGSYTAEQIPITVDMLDITVEELLTPGTYTCTVTYEDRVISDDYKLTVTGEKKEVTPISDKEAFYLTDNAAEVTAGAIGSLQTGDSVVVYTIGDDGVVSEQEYPITISMLSATSKQLNTVGTYTVALTYDYRIITEEYTLKVVAAKVNDYPDFPDEGAVKIDKWADTSHYEYFGTGTAQVNLSVTGIPSRNKANAVIVLDASSSMRICVHGAQADYSDKWTDDERASLKSFLLDDITDSLTAEEQALFQRLYERQSSVDENYQKAFDTRMAGGESYGSEYVSRLKKWLALSGYCSSTGKWAGMDSHECYTREKILEDALVKLLDDFAAEDATGQVPDVDVAIAYFNSYTQIDSNYVVKDSGTHFGAAPTNGGETILPFTSSSDITEEVKASVLEKYKTTYGTNYDDGLQQAYELLKAKQEKDYRDYLNGDTTEPYEPRQDFVIFMSDGQPYQFNYFGGGHGNWSKWFNGQMDEALAELQKTQPDATYADAGFVAEEYLEQFEAYYHPEGKLWMAEAIKGDETAKYKIIDPTSPADDLHIEYVNGLGATLLGIGFNLGADGGYHDVMQRIATSDGHYTACETAEDIENAFGAFATLVRSANNAVFTDQMGEDFDLVISKHYPTNSGMEPYSDAPMITLTRYETYKHSEEETGLCEEDMVGKRKPDSAEVLEVIQFPQDDMVTSSLLSENILKDMPTTKDDTTKAKVICAKNFYYNTDKTLTAKITVNGQTVELAPETFCWNVGAITEDELVLSYYVYLTGSMEGDGSRMDGQYDTNEFAELTYTNYLGHNCEQSVPTPVLPWGQATVGYAFYLVDEDGKPIINQTSGATGSFEQAIRITEPVYETFPWNADKTTIDAAIVAKDKLPDGYTLFDENAAYQVQLKSDGDGFYKIFQPAKKDAANNLIESTYVMGVEKTAVTGNGQPDDPATEADERIVNTTNSATANTVVWFAVYAGVAAVPDTVVIDYGLPVEIDVMANDTMMGTNGHLTYLGDKSNFPEYTGVDEDGNNLELWKYLQDYGVSKAPVFETTQVPGTYGVAKLNDQHTKVRYTLNESDNLLMDREETFVYAVNYDGTADELDGYYYSTVTVIPATTIYYEDTFVTYKSYQYISDTQYKQGQEGNRTTAAELVTPDLWTPVGDTIDALQAEDRPGSFSLSHIDANNIYGYDQAYENMTQYSLGSAMKFTASAIANTAAGMEGTLTKTYGTAEFTFKGTGFDIISLTSNRSGTITVEVYKKSDNSLATFTLVDTYYGYKWANGEWVPDENASDCLYQVPVIKVKDLAYDTYSVKITASYAEAFDHGQYGDAKYDFYLDAIRIYDPANDGAGNDVIEGAYVDDSEGWPEYFELRNLLISVNDFNTADDIVNGIIFIDGNDSLSDNNASGADPGYGTSPADKTPAITDYANFGPNNELYLAPGQAVAFDLAVPGDDVASVQIAMKSVGGTAYVKYYDVRVNNIDNAKPTKLNTATDLYYDITSLNGKTVVIANSGSDTDAVLSITNIKVTYKAAHTDSLEAGILGITKKSAAEVLNSLTSRAIEETPVEPETPDVEPSVPETPDGSFKSEDSAIFQPQRFDVTVLDNVVVPGGEIVVSVDPSADIDHVTIDGMAPTETVVDPDSGLLTWKFAVDEEDVGKQTLEVVAYNADNEASAAVIKTVSVMDTGRWNATVSVALLTLLAILATIGLAYRKWN